MVPMDAKMESRFGMGPFIFSTNHKLVWKVPSQIWTPFTHLTRPTHPKIGVFFQMGPEIQSCDWWTQRTGPIQVWPYCFPDPNTIKYKGRAPDYCILLGLHLKLIYSYKICQNFLPDAALCSLEPDPCIYCIRVWETIGPFGRGGR